VSGLRRSPLAVVAAVAVLLVALAVAAAPPEPAAAAQPPVPVPVLDTRAGPRPAPLPPHHPATLRVAGIPGVPAEAAVVVLDITLVDPGGPGSLSVWPAGQLPPAHPTLTWSAGLSVLAQDYVAVGAGGEVVLDIVWGAAADVVVEVSGWFPAGEASAVPPVRRVDTRGAIGPLFPGETVGVGGVERVTVLGGVGGDVVLRPAGGGPEAVVATLLPGGTTGFLVAAPAGSTLVIGGGGDVVVDHLGELQPGLALPPLRMAPPSLAVAGTNGLEVSWKGAAPRDATVVRLQTLTGQVDRVVVGGTRTSVVLDGLPGGVVTATVAPLRGSAEGAASGTGSLSGRFVPFGPVRLLDTRELGHALADGDTFLLGVGGIAGVPANATAVVVNLTATDTTGPGFVTAYPSALDRPTVSNLNIPGPGATVANLAVVPLAADGTLSLYAERATHLVVDVAGYWVPAATAAAGRLGATAPVRLVDSRDGTGGVSGPLPPGGSVDVQVRGVAGVPDDASAVVFTLTATDTAGPGWFSARPAGTPFQSTSNLNATAPGQTIANLVVVPIGADGRVTLSAQTGGHVVVDVSGWFSGSATPAGSDGLYVPVVPRRLLDTREGGARLGGEPGQELAVAGRGGVPAGGAAAAVVANVTATDGTGPGYVTVWPAGQLRPLASTLNVTAPGETVPNLALSALGDGRLGLYASDGAGVHAVVDVAGWFTIGR